MSEKLLTSLKLSTIPGYMNSTSPTGTPLVPLICQICLAAQPGSPKSTLPIALLLPMLLPIMVFSEVSLHIAAKLARPSQTITVLNTPTSMAAPLIQVPSGENPKISLKEASIAKALRLRLKVTSKARLTNPCVSRIYIRCTIGPVSAANKMATISKHISRN